MGLGMKEEEEEEKFQSTAGVELVMLLSDPASVTSLSGPRTSGN